MESGLPPIIEQPDTTVEGGDPRYALRPEERTVLALLEQFSCCKQIATHKGMATVRQSA